MKTHRKLVAALAVVALLAPVAMWLFFKPIRILAPGFNGVTCAGPVCSDLPSELDRAARLHAEAMAAVGRKLTPLREPPLTVFCSTRSCYQTFGGGMERGATILDFGVILPPESWVAHIIEHEFIHMLQAQELGLRGRERTPGWFKEGMPFLVSAPPDYDLPDYARPLVAQYRTWRDRVGEDQVWTEAGKLPR